MLVVSSFASGKLRQGGVVLGLVLGQSKAAHFYQKIEVTRLLVIKNAVSIALDHRMPPGYVKCGAVL